MIAGLAFATPLALLALLALPILWWILRAVPPAPIRRRFPGVALLLGLRDDDSQTDKTPWWLLALRIAALAAAIIGFSGPALNPQPLRDGTGPVLIVMDSSWASAPDWAARRDRAALLLDEAARSGRPVALVQLTDLPGGEIALQSANAVLPRLPSLVPTPFAPDMAAATEWAQALPAPLETWWISDGIAHAGRDDLAQALMQKGALSVFEGARDVIALAPPQVVDGMLEVTAMRRDAIAPLAVEVVAHGLDPLGIARELARVSAGFDASADMATASFDLPPELRNRITRFEIAGQRGAGGVALTDDALQRRQVALIAGGASDEQQALLSPLHYLRQALAPQRRFDRGGVGRRALGQPRCDYTGRYRHSVT